MTLEQAIEVLTDRYNSSVTRRRTDAEWRLATDTAIAALRQGWVRTAERVPEGDEHKEILGLYKGKDYYLYDIVQIGWLRLHPEMYPYWTDLPAKPE